MQSAEEGTLPNPWGQEQQYIQKNKNTSFMHWVIKNKLSQQYSVLEQKIQDKYRHNVKVRNTQLPDIEKKKKKGTIKKINRLKNETKGK